MQLASELEELISIEQGSKALQQQQQELGGMVQ